MNGVLADGVTIGFTVEILVADPLFAVACRANLSGANPVAHDVVGKLGWCFLSWF